MPIWMELVVLGLLAYFIGIAIGWALFGQSMAGNQPASGTQESE